MFTNPITNKMADFIRETGIEIFSGKYDEETNLPGIKIDAGKIIVDEEKLLYPGDLLHEAGHLAIKEKSERDNLKVAHINGASEPAEEMMAMAWSYSASVKLGIAPEVIFHPDGYKGQANQLIESYRTGFSPGLPMLQWYGMSYDASNAQQQGVAPFPFMVKWTRD